MKKKQRPFRLPRQLQGVEAAIKIAAQGYRKTNLHAMHLAYRIYGRSGMAPYNDMLGACLVLEICRACQGREKNKALCMIEAQTVMLQAYNEVRRVNVALMQARIV